MTIEEIKSIAQNNELNITDTRDFLIDWINNDQDKLFKSTYAESIKMVKSIVFDLNKFLEESSILFNSLTILSNNLKIEESRFDMYRKDFKYMLELNKETHKNNLVNFGNSLVDLAQQYNVMYNPNDIINTAQNVINKYNQRVTEILEYQTFDHPTVTTYNLKNFLLGRNTVFLRLYLRSIDLKYIK